MGDEVAVNAVAPEVAIWKVTVWGDGKLVGDSGGGGGVWSGSGTSRAGVIPTVNFWPGEGTVDVLFLKDEPGNPIAGVASSALTIPGAPSPFVLPTVPSGQVLTTPTVRSLFSCGPGQVVPDGTAGVLAAAGVNCLELSAFVGGGDLGGTHDLAVWRAGMDGQVWAHVDWCVANGRDFLGTGDNFCRFGYQQDWLHTSPIAEAAVRETARRLRDCGRCRGIEMVDEVGPDPAAYGIADFVAWWRDEGGPPLAWPGHSPALWDVPELSDYSSRFHQHYDGVWIDRRASLWQHRRAVLNVAAVNVPASRPWSCLVSAMGPFYDKFADAAEFVSGVDKLRAGGARGFDVVAQVWLALAAGASRLRCYSYDHALWRNQRANGVPGVFFEHGYQTGCGPWSGERWTGLAAAYGSVATREAVLAGTPYVSTESGPWVFGRRGNLVFGINTSERALPSPNGTGTVVIAPAGVADRRSAP